MTTLCGRLTQTSMSAHGTSIEEEFEIVKFVENNAPFVILLGKTWIEKDQIRKKQEEKDLEHKKNELRDFMARRITHLLEEQEDQSKLLRTKYLDVKVERTQEDLKHMSIQKSRAPTPEREEVLPSNPIKYPPQCEVTMPRVDKNNNGKRKLVTQITGKKARKLSKKKAKLEKLQKFQGGLHRRKVFRTRNSLGYQNNEDWHFTKAKQYDH
jgi:hypothetical protein